MKLLPGARFLLVLVAVSFLYNFHDIIRYPPFSNHYWRQADGYSMALNYYHEGMNFCAPKIHHQGSVDGRGVGEFPGLYYLNALIWKITTPNFITFRLLNLIITFLGLFFLFKTAFYVLKDFTWACAIALFVLSSPLYAFYANNFMINAAALGLIFIAWYLIIVFSAEKKSRYFCLSVFLMILSVLLRATMIIGVLPLILILFLELVGFLKSGIFHKKGLHLFMLLLPVICLLAWVILARYYNKTYVSRYFLTTIRPLWEADDIRQIWSGFYKNALHELHFMPLLILVPLILVVMFITGKKQNRYGLIFTVIVALELSLYLVLWFNNLTEHEYYLLELFLIVPPLFVSFLWFLKSSKATIFNSKKVKMAVMAVLIFCTYCCALKERIKYDYAHTWPGTHVIILKDEFDWRAYSIWDYFNRFKAYQTITPYIRSLGMNRDDLVVSIPDISPNVSLSLMDQKGFTSLYYNDMPEGERIRLFISSGAKYLFINDPELYKNPEIAYFTTKKIGQYHNIGIFDLRNLK
ncbi:MAG TPA: hypothetical protein PKW80_03645 [Bacteroidales bacterium]|nr:hypothetical protein [Bacteroidales bacterium]